MARSDLPLMVSARNRGGRTGIGMDLGVSSCYSASPDLPDAISMASLDYDGVLRDRPNYGSGFVDLAALGAYILSTTADQGYSCMAGASMAVPMVSAATALVYSYGENISGPQSELLRRS